MRSSALFAVSSFVGFALVGGQSSSAASSTSLSPAQITHFITVANNLTATNASNVFQPNVVNASLGETVYFNFTQGNHSATQSTFAVPCVPASQSNSSINGFNTGLRPAGNGTSITNFIIIMNPDIVNTTLWFYDINTCGIGGVGVINAGNVTATDQPYDAFVRNAERLNGTHTSSAVPSPTPPSSGSNSGGGSDSGSGSSNSTGAALPQGALAPAMILVPFFAAAAALL
ncbi:hypothetical protein DFH07DRAFT_217303 [Mycena maculata]|uniref:Extracellular serine-rich protein n=1 Tax=Mycena maculata TaxID=230809 RepID=A0AAD7JUW2_9AGAR|nr:hypothetical protein DFH07DRAFT_217303 [Mycena maculata]